MLEATIGSPESRKYDRTSLDECIRRANVLTVAGILNDRADFLNQAAVNLRYWFIDPVTRTLPSARFAQYHMHETKDQRDPVNPAGLIDFRDIWTLTYIVPRLHGHSALTDAELQQLRLWCAAFFADLVDSKQGRKAYEAANNIGTCGLASRVTGRSRQFISGRKPLAQLILCRLTTTERCSLTPVPQSGNVDL